MPRVFPVAALLFMVACTPTFNWREITIAPSGLHVVFPCKPDQAERKIAFTRGRELLVHAVGCETGGASYAVLWADADAAAELDAMMAQWKQASLVTARARIERETPFVPRGALELPQSRLVRANGQRSDGSDLQSQAAYFARGNSIFQTVIYAEALRPEMTESFFAGLRFE